MAARKAFAAEGYSGAATRRIAAKAGTAETLIFRHFGSKAGLYRSAVLERAPWLLVEFQWHEAPRAPEVRRAADAARAWIDHLLTVMERNRDLVAGLLNHGLEIDDDPELTVDIQNARRELFRVLDDGARQALGVSEPSVRFSLAVRSVFTTVVSVSAYSTLFEMPGGVAAARLHRDDILRLGSISLMAARPV